MTEHIISSRNLRKTDFLQQVLLMAGRKCKIYAGFVKLKLSLLVSFSGIVGLILASHAEMNLPLVAAFGIGLFLIIGGANGFNEILERKEDGLMRRTACRPLPTRQISVKEACLFASFAALLGTLILGFFVEPLTALLAVVAFCIYVFAYTPAKKKGAWCVFVGAISGAMPAMMGPVSAQHSITAFAWLMFSIVFFWQFPHFCAIAWLSKEDYRKAGFRVFPASCDEKFVPYNILVGALALLAVCPLLYVNNWTGFSCLWGSLILSSVLFLFTLRFWKKCSTVFARQLMKVSLAYLPLLFFLMLADKISSPW